MLDTTSPPVLRDLLPPALLHAATSSTTPQPPPPPRRKREIPVTPPARRRRAAAGTVWARRSWRGWRSKRPRRPCVRAGVRAWRLWPHRSRREVRARQLRPPSVGMGLGCASPSGPPPTTAPTRCPQAMLQATKGASGRSGGCRRQASSAALQAGCNPFECFLMWIYGRFVPSSSPKIRR